MKTKRTKTANDGASIERAAIKRFITRQMPKNCGNSISLRSYRNALNHVLDFITTRTARTAARKGGLGRK